MASYSWGGPPDDEAPPPKDAPSGFHVITPDDTAASKTAHGAGKKYDWGRTPGSEPMKLKKGFLNVPRHHPLPDPYARFGSSSMSLFCASASSRRQKRTKSWWL